MEFSVYMPTENNNNNSNNNNNNNSTQTQTLKRGFVSPLVRVCIYSLHLFCIDLYIKDPAGETNAFCFALQNRTIVDKQPPLFELQMLLEYYKSKEWEPFTDLYL